MRPLDQGSTSLGIICDNHLLNLICAVLWINLGKVELKSKRQLAETTTKNKKPSKPMQQKCLRLLKTSFSHLECGGGEQVRAAASSGRGWARYVCCSYKSQTFPIQKQLPLKAAGLSVEGPRGFILQLDCKFTANNWNKLLLCVFLYQTAAARWASLCWWPLLLRRTSHNSVDQPLVMSQRVQTPHWYPTTGQVATLFVVVPMQTFQDGTKRQF